MIPVSVLGLGFCIGLQCDGYRFLTVCFLVLSLLPRLTMCASTLRQPHARGSASKHANRHYLGNLAVLLDKLSWEKIL